MMRSYSSYFRFCAAIGVVFLALNAAAQLPPEAQRAFDRGMAAVEQKAWDLAIKYFDRAQEEAPEHPPTLLNLGLAHARAGNDLRAISWFETYLAALPNVENARSVQSMIAKLDVNIENKINKVFREAIDMALLTKGGRWRIPDGSGWPYSKQVGPCGLLLHVAYVQASIGDVEAARRTVALRTQAPSSGEICSEPIGDRLERWSDMRLVCDRTAHAPGGRVARWTSRARHPYPDNADDFDARLREAARESPEQALPRMVGFADSLGTGLRFLRSCQAMEARLRD